VPQGLLRLHVAACTGNLPAEPLSIDNTRIRGEATVFTTRACTVTRDHVARLAELGCRDVPQPHTRLPSGAPLCTVAAQGASAAAVDQQLAAHEAAVRAMVQNRDEVHSHGD